MVNGVKRAPNLEKAYVCDIRMHLYDTCMSAVAACTAEYSVCVHTSGFGTPPPGHVPATALHLKEKAQHAGYKAPVEKWDTDLGAVRQCDSDSSDGSDDELDLAV